MSWNSIVGHDVNGERFDRAAAAGRLAGAFLFVGPPGVGKRTFAFQVAQGLLCESEDRNVKQPLSACGACDACKQTAALTHPDLEYVSRPADRSFIPVETFIGDREHRMRQGLCHRISLKPFRGGRKIALIDDADYLNEEGANCLLKTLEEPPPRSLIILIGESEHKQLPTIRSRCRTIRFSPLPQQTVANLLQTHLGIDDPAHAARLAELSGGSLGRAIEMNEPAVEGFRRELFAHLASQDPPPGGFIRQTIAFVEQAGKEAPPRRRRMRFIMGVTAEFYQTLMRRLAGFSVADGAGDTELEQFTAAAAAWWNTDEETAGDCVTHCLTAQNHVEANANQTALLEWWLDELAQISAGLGAQRI